MCGFHGKVGRKRPLGRFRRRCEDNIKIDFKERKLGNMNYIHLGQYRDKLGALVNMVGSETSGSI
jgi:hypothetical protein